MLKLTVGLALVTLVACLQCPNNVCEAGQTCCQAPSGDTSCCPLNHGECCEDHLHCCPEGMLCQVKDSMCQNATHSLPWVKRLHVEQTSFPTAAAVVPKMSAESTTNSQITTTLSQREFLKNSDVPCDDTVACPDESTCCKTKDGGWACCPLPQAVCCEDFVHCCPHGKKCDVAAAACEDPSGSVPWFEKMPVHPISSLNSADTQVSSTSDVPCDDTVACPDDSTCCKTKDGGWACCPLPEAVCCEDFVHCCPHGKKCNVAAESCDDPSGSMPWFEKMPVQPISSQNAGDTKLSSTSDVPCDDTVACPDESTCCKTKDGGWACCPLPEAVCCDDFVHCCPHGKKCDVAAAACEDPSGSMPWFEKMPVHPINSLNSANTQDSDVPCDDTVACPDDSTCCKTKDGGWACCPLPEAVCCEDFVHCCPHGTKCNLAAETCDDPSGSMLWFEKMPVQPNSSQNVGGTKLSSTSDVPCDDTVACPDESTCCKTKDGGWACCPLPQAVCCEDFVHCCPHGKICDVAAAACEDPSGSMPWFEKMPVHPISSLNSADTQVSSVSSDSDVPCDDTVACPDDSTCCKTKDGGWACCPLPEAVCCEDFVHCCPHGTKCNVAAESCDDPSGSMPWFEKMPVQPISSQNAGDTKLSSTSDVPCDDTVACPDESTCCKTKDGGWACCPLPEAVCCEDFVHCCPHGKKCDVAAESCEDPSGSVPWFEKLPTRPREDLGSHENKSCDSSHFCPKSNTCCKNIDGDWNCCPMPEAVCCRDHLHCCPQGFTCNFITLTCDSGSSSVPMTVIIPSSAKEGHRQTQHGEVKEETGVRKYDSRVPCDAHTSCPDHTTCCIIAKTSKWGCCPLPNAVCCKDGEHCCPADYECDVSKVSCIKRDAVIPWYNKIAAKSTPAPSSDLGNVKCDEQTSCSTGSTCCRLSTGTWGCCPLPEAVCCPDHEHCCPNGYTCDMSGSSCIQNPWMQVDRVPLTHTGGKEQQPISSVKDIQCGDGHSCLDSETCCKTSETTWGCCPSPKAVCCDDMKHCCPAGYTCGKDGICNKPKSLEWNSWGN